MATLDGNDLKAIKDLIEVTLDEKLDEKLDVKLSHLPTKDEFYEQTGKILNASMIWKRKKTFYLIKFRGTATQLKKSSLT